MTEDRRDSENSLLRERVTEPDTLANECLLAREALRSSEEKYRSLFEESRDAIYISTTEGIIKEANQAALSLFGYSREEMIGLDAKLLYADPADRGRFKDVIKKQGFVKGFEVTLRRKDGSVRYCLLTSSMRRDQAGNLIGYQGIIHDITRHKQADEALRLSEEKFSKVFQSSPDWIVISTLEEGRLIDVNDAFLRISGYTRAEVIGRTSSELNLWVDHGERERMVLLLRQKGSIKDEEVKFRMKSGAVLTMLRSAELMTLNGTQCIINITRDITSRKKAERSLRKSEEKYRALLDGASDAIVIADMEGHLIDLNKKAEALFGYPREEFLHMEYRDLHPKETLYRTVTAFEQIRESGYGELINGEVLRKGGSRIPVDVTGSVIEYGGRKVLLGIFRDITERKEAEEALARSEELLRKMLQTLPVGVWIFDDKGFIITSNPAGREIWGGEKKIGIEQFDETRAWRVDTGRRLAPEEWASYRAIRHGETSLNEEIEIECLDGTRKIVLYSALPIRDRDKKVVGAIAINQDITERKKADQEIRKLNVELKQHVDELTDTNRELEAFSYSVSHDLRVPLVIIGGYARRLLKDRSELFDQPKRDTLDVILSTAKKAEQLIDNLLTLSRSGRQPLTMTEMDMNELARATFEELRTIHPERPVTFILNPLPQVRGDRSLLKQVWTNLFSNALKYTVIRKVSVIEVSGKIEDGEAVFWVKDNGIGFEMKRSPAIFSVFERLHSKEEFEGTGVGLSIVQRIIQRHNGRVWAEGKVDEGATFYFSLPMKRPLQE